MPQPLGPLLWIYFMISQVVLLNLLVAIMGETWEKIKENADDEWKLLTVNAMQEYFELHHVPPPFNGIHMLRALISGSEQEGEVEEERCTRRQSSDDVIKRSKQARLQLLKDLGLKEENTIEARLKALQHSGREAADNLSRLLISQERQVHDFR